MKINLLNIISLLNAFAKPEVAGISHENVWSESGRQYLFDIGGVRTFSNISLFNLSNVNLYII